MIIIKIGCILLIINEAQNISSRLKKLDDTDKSQDCILTYTNISSQTVSIRILLNQYFLTIVWINIICFYNRLGSMNAILSLLNCLYKTVIKK